MLMPIYKGEGTTTGERELAKIADLSFFGLWSYPSIHRKMVKGGNTLRHEVADLIVVFGKDVIIFSEKDIKFPDTEDLKITWGRWFRQSVIESIGQLRGAERYVKSRDSALFLDARCTQPFPFALDASDLKIHLVAICRNSSKPAKSYFNQFTEKDVSGSSGSLLFFAPIREKEMVSNPFHVGDFDPEKTFVHVFDEDSLSLLLTELDAGPDFIHYLDTREQAVRKKRLSVFYGEEDFLAVYLSNIRETGFGAYQTDNPLSTGSDEDLHIIEEGMWLAFRATYSYAVHSAQRKDSGNWKSLTNDFSQAILTATVGEALDESLDSHERAVRAMASENRVSRAILGHALIEKYNTVPTNVRSARVITSLSNPERLYIFLLFPLIDAHGTYDNYRVERTACMQMYVRAAQLKFSSYSEIVVLGADTKGSGGSSETILVAEGAPNMSDLEKAEIQAMMDEYNVLTDISPARPSGYQSGLPKASIFDGTLPLGEKIPGVNEPCFCGSGRKYKKCCRP